MVDRALSNAVKLCFLLSLGFDINTTLIRHEWVCLYPGTSVDYAQELIEDTVEIPESLQYYIDYEAIARDKKLNGEIVEIEDNLIVTNALEF